jgi:hypothetical protein
MAQELAALHVLRYWFGHIQVIAHVSGGERGGGGEPPPRWPASSSP